MQIPVLIERIAGNGYRAQPLDISAEGATQEEAVEKLKEQLKSRLQNGATLVPVDLGADEHPLAEFAGMFKDDPWIADWKKSMAEYRQKVDQAPEL